MAEKSAKELMLKKPNQTVMITNREITATQRKAYNVLLHKAAQKLKINPNEDIFYVLISEVKELAGIKATDNWHLKEDLKVLMDIKIECVREKNDWAIFNLLSEVKMHENFLSFEFSSTIRKSLIQNNYYTTLNLLTLKSLTGKYAIIFYELAMRYHKVEIPQLGIDEFKSLTGTESYKNFNDLKRKCIEPGIEEVNEKSDIIMDYNIFKAGRKVVAIKFSVKQMVLEPTPSHEISPSEQSIKIDKETIKSLNVPGTAPELVRQTIEECGIEAVTEIYNAFLDKLKKAQNGKGKKIEDPAAYYANNLRKRIGAKTPEQREAEKEKKLAAEKQRQERLIKDAQEAEKIARNKIERERDKQRLEALSASDREKLRALAIEKMASEGIPKGLASKKVIIENRMRLLLDDFLAAKTPDNR